MNDAGNLREKDTKDLPPLCRQCGKELTAPENINKNLLVVDSKTGRLATILSCQDHNNIVLAGPAGTGKTALVQAIACEIAQGKYKALEGKRLVEINIEILLEGRYSAADQGKRMGNLLSEAVNENIILFFDEGHRLYGAGESSSLANLMKPLLTDGRLQVILATTDYEYEKFIARDPAFKRRFEKVAHKAPDEEETLQILRCVLKKRYPGYAASDDVLKKIVTIGRLYLKDRNDPDRSLSILDLAVAWNKNNGDDGTISMNGLLASIAMKYELPKNALSLDMESRHKGMYERLAGKFCGWETLCRRISEALEKWRTRESRSGGPLVLVTLCGPDPMLLHDAALEACLKLTGGNRQSVVIQDVNKPYLDELFVNPVRERPEGVYIFSGINYRTVSEALTRLREIAVSGVLQSLSNPAAKADYRRSYVFLLLDVEHAGQADRA